MDWNNVNLKNAYERDQNIIDSLSFGALLLEVSCNVRNITKETVMKQFEESLKSRINSAREVMRANLKNITKDALEYRNLD